MEFFEVLKKRHSIRAFKDKEVGDRVLKKILRAANSAPSAGNLQAYEIVVVREKRRKIKVAEASYAQEFIAEAPVVFVFLAAPDKSARKYGRRGSKFYCIQDATIAAAYAQLAAAALGLGSVWVGAFDIEALASAVGAAKEVPVAVLPIGYPDETPFHTSRRKLSEIAHEEKLR